VLALWRTHGDDTTLTIFSAQDAPMDSLTVTLPANAAQGTLILGNGRVSIGESGKLEVGPFTAFDCKVLRFRQ